MRAIKAAAAATVEASSISKSLWRKGSVALGSTSNATTLDTAGPKIAKVVNLHILHISWVMHGIHGIIHNVDPFSKSNRAAGDVIILVSVCQERKFGREKRRRR